MNAIREIPYTIHLHIWRAAIFDMCSILSHRVGEWPHIRRVNRQAVNDKLTKFAHTFVHRCRIYLRRREKKDRTIELRKLWGIRNLNYYLMQSLLSKYRLALSTIWATLFISMVWLFGKLSNNCAYDVLLFDTWIGEFEIAFSCLREKTGEKKNEENSLINFLASHSRSYCTLWAGHRPFAQISLLAITVHLWIQGQWASSLVPYHLYGKDLTLKKNHVE